MTATPTMKRPVRKSSLLIDYSKSKATSDELNNSDVVFTCSSPTSSSPRAPLRAKSMCLTSSQRRSSNGRDTSNIMSLANLVSKGRRRSGSFSIKRDQQQEQNELDESASSIGLPDLDPLLQESSSAEQDSQIFKTKSRKNNSSSIRRSGSALGASHDTFEQEGDDSFCLGSNSNLPSMDLRSSMHAARVAPATSAAGGSRRALLQTTRRYQSMSSLSPPPGGKGGAAGRTGGKRQQRNTLAGGEQPTLSFSLRRRSSCRSINTTSTATTAATAETSSTTGSSSHSSKRAPMGRCKTWDDRSAERFHQSMSALNFDVGAAERFHQSMSAIGGGTDLDCFNLDETEHSTAAPEQQQQPADNQKTVEPTPSENRRKMLVRHSSVSALQRQPSHLELLTSPQPSTHSSKRDNRRRVGRQTSLRQIFPDNLSRCRSPNSSILPADDETLPDTISIQSHRKSSSSRTMKRSKTLDGTTKRSSTHEKKTKEKRDKTSSKNNKSGPGALDRHLSRRSSDGSKSRKNSKSKATMPTLEVDDMSFSSHSYFSSAAGTSASRVSRCPSTRGASGPLRGNLVASKTPPSTRRDMLQRQLSSRRNLGSNMASSIALGTSSSNLMDDSSHFVTGSRIRRGRSCRQLLM